MSIIFIIYVTIYLSSSSIYLSIYSFIHLFILSAHLILMGYVFEAFHCLGKPNDAADDRSKTAAECLIFLTG